MKNKQNNKKLQNNPPPPLMAVSFPSRIFPKYPTETAVEATTKRFDATGVQKKK